MNILNIHGYAGSAENTNYSILREAGYTVIGFSIDYDSCTAIDVEDFLLAAVRVYKLLWEYVKPRKCNKPYNYYPRGRVELNNKGEPVIYMNPNISEEFIPTIMDIFEIKVVPKIVRFSIVSKKSFQESS